MRYITSKSAYQGVYEDNELNVLRGNLFIFLISNNLKKSLAVGLVVSRKVGNAVVRNKTKRRVKAFLRENIPETLVGKNIVIKSKPESGSSSWIEIKKDLAELFAQIQ